MALEAKPARKNVPDERGKSSDHGAIDAVPIRGSDAVADQHRCGALERIEQQRQRCEALVPGPEHVGRADVA